MNKAPFIPVWFDELGLRPIPFRILAHLYRRAGTKLSCWPGAESIQRACRVSDDAFWPAIHELEQRGLIRREKRRYNSNEYFLTIPDVTPENRVTVSPTETGEQSPTLGGEQLPTETGEQSPTETGDKGLEKEMSPRRRDRKVCAPASLTCPWFGFPDLPEDLRTFAVDKFGNEALAADGVVEIIGRKLRYNDTQPNLAAWCAALRSEISDTTNVRAKGRGFAQQHTYAGVTSKVGDSTQRSAAAEPQPVAEPADWRELLPTDDDDRVRFASSRWEAVLPFYQARIVAKVAAITAGGQAA